MTKACRDCKQVSPVTNFRKNPNGRFGVASYCKPCQSKRSRAHYLANLEHHKATRRRYGLKKRYGLSITRYNEMFVAQFGLCAICKEPSKTNLHVDHEHRTGHIRGLLCAFCNRFLGQYERYGQAAAQYLRGENPEPVPLPEMEVAR